MATLRGPSRCGPALEPRGPPCARGGAPRAASGVGGQLCCCRDGASHHAAAAMQPLHERVHLAQVEHGLAVDADAWTVRGGAIGNREHAAESATAARLVALERQQRTLGPKGQAAPSQRVGLWRSGWPRGLLRARPLWPGRDAAAVSHRGVASGGLRWEDARENDRLLVGQRRDARHDEVHLQPHVMEPVTDHTL